MGRSDLEFFKVLRSFKIFLFVIFGGEIGKEVWVMLVRGFFL